MSLQQWSRIERYSDTRRKPFGDALVPISNRVEHEFDSGGDAQPVENAEKIFLDGVRLDQVPEPPRDWIRLRPPAQPPAPPGRQQTGAAGIDHSPRRLEELLTNAMLFVLPWEIVGRSLALLEALAAGLCVLTSDIPENREFVDGVGFTFRKNDAKDLERMLRLRIADGEVRRSAGRHAKHAFKTDICGRRLLSRSSKFIWR